MTRAVARGALCLAGLVALIVWQAALFRMPWGEAYPFKASSGISEQDKFVYFLYYTNTFPIASTNNGLNFEFFFSRAPIVSTPNTLDYSAAGARRIIADAGQTLVMEWGHALRSGQLLSTYLYLPDAWRLGSPQFAEVRMTHGALFILALASVYLMSWWVGAAVFGTVLVVLIGSDPFQLYEAYRHENVFSWPITAFCFMLALALPLLTGRRLSSWYAMAVAVVAAVFAGTANQIRPEPIMLLGGLVLALLCAGSLTWRVRLVAVALLVVTTVVTLRAWDRYFDKKFDQAAVVVAAAGGHVLPNPPGHYHAFWHSIWCGLSDFDQTHEYAWSDSAALTFAQPILKARYAEDLPWWWGVKGKEDHERAADDYLDADRTYYKIPFRAPHYEDVMRDKVLGDIRADPLWYAGILGRRVVRLLTETTRPQLTLTTSSAIPLWPAGSLLIVPLLLIAVVFRRWADLKILAFSAAISLPVLLVFSGRGMTNYSVFHLCAFALLAGAAELVPARTVSA